MKVAESVSASALEASPLTQEGGALNENQAYALI
jgi:hypothetical protein